MSRERVQTVRVRTPEGVAFTFRVASPVLRLGALFVDWLVIAATWSLLSFLVTLARLVSSDFAGMVAALGWFVLSWGYDIVCEARWRGQTLGKKLLRLRVVDERGFRLGISQIILRNLLRIVDALPVAYLVGGLAALINRRGQRLGDLAAGTLVIHEPSEPMPDQTLLGAGKYNSLRDHPGVVARLRQQIAPAEARLAWQALARAPMLEPDARLTVFAELAAWLRDVTPIPDEATDGVSDEQFVRNVVEILFVNRARPGSR